MPGRNPISSSSQSTRRPRTGLLGKYGLTAQARRAAVSVTNNLAEGTARLGGRELRRFADISVGSLSELSNILRIARDLGFTTPDRWESLNALRDHAGKLVFGLARSAVRIRSQR